jgi:hypothetical protein
MIAKLAYLTTPGPDRFVLNIQPFGSDDLIRFEIAKAHLVNILIDGASLAFREQYPNRVPNNSSQESADGSAGAGAQR